MSTPNVTVEIDVSGGAWNAARVWTDVSAYALTAMSPITVTWGRRDESSIIDPATCTIVLDNSDGRFTPSRVASPYYPRIKRGLPVRVRVNPAGTAYTRFTGFVDTITQTIAGSWSQVTLTCNDVLARVRARRPMYATPAEEAIYRGATAHWPFVGDTSNILGTSRAASLVQGKTAATTTTYAYDVPGSGALSAEGGSTLRLAANWNSSGGYNDGGYLVSLGTALPFTSGAASLSFWMRGTTYTRNENATFFLNADPTGYQMVQMLWDSVPSGSVGLSVAVSGSAGPNVTLTSMAPTIMDLRWHHIALTIGAGTVTVYVDGVQVGTGAGPTSFPSGGNALLGGELDRFFPTGSYFFAGSFAHVSMFPFALTSAAVLALYQAGSAFAGSTTTTFANSLANYLGLASNLSANPDGHQVGSLNTDGSNGFDALMAVATTADRPIYADPTGTLQWGDDPYNLTTDITLTADDLDGELGITHDSQLQFNTVTVSHPAGSERYVDTAARTADGPMETSLTSAAYSAVNAYQLATWFASQHKNPSTRYSALTLDCLTTTVSLATLMGLKPNSIITVTGLSTLAPGTSYSGYIEGCTETIGPREWSMAFLTAPLYPQIGNVGANNATSTLIDNALVGY